MHIVSQFSLTCIIYMVQVVQGFIGARGRRNAETKPNQFERMTNDTLVQELALIHPFMS